MAGRRRVRLSMSALPSRETPSVFCWNLVGPPWPVVLEPLQQVAWSLPADAWATAQPLAALTTELARKLSPDFPDVWPRPPSSPDLREEKVSAEPKNGIGLAWTATLRKHRGIVERRLVIETRGLPDGLSLSLAWSEMAVPPGVLRSQRELRVTVEAPEPLCREIEAAVSAMVSRTRQAFVAPPSASRERARTLTLQPRDYFAGALFLLVVTFFGVRSLSGGVVEMRRFLHAPHFVEVSGSVVSVTPVAVDARSSERTRLGAELSPEIEIGYSMDGSRSIRFVDGTIRRQTPAIVRALGETAWGGRPIPLFVDPDRPWDALTERPGFSAAALGRLLLGLLLLVPAAALGFSFVRERWPRHDPSNDEDEQSVTAP